MKEHKCPVHQPEQYVRIELRDGGGVLWWSNVYIYPDSTPDSLLDHCVRVSLAEALATMRETGCFEAKA